MNYVSKECENCQVQFQTEQRYINRGHGKFCSRACSGHYNGEQRRDSKEHNVACALDGCSVTFHKSPSKMLNSRSGIFFCSRAHKDEAQRIGGIRAIMPAHYGSSMTDYRTKALRALPNICAKCGYDKYLEVLEVNHIDCDRSNNDISNLEILCPTCHSEFHFKTKTGCWARTIPE